jgi:flagellar biosynthesis GTPase FlhF
MLIQNRAPQSLHLKSYFSGTVEAAIALARRELGEDALLVNAREATPETRRYGAYEVVFGLSHPLPAQPPPLPRQTVANPVQALAEDIADLRRQMLSLRNGKPEPAVQIEQVTTDATLGRAGSATAHVMLVGPPGVGKTSTLVKIAARYGVHINKATHVLTTDVNRVAASDQLHALAAILGAGFDTLDPVSLLPQALVEHAGKALVMVDTPGFALEELTQPVELAHAVAACGDLDVHLVLSASMKASDALRIADAYSIFRPNKLIFTRIDETLDCTSVMEVAAHLNLPVSFLASGRRIPLDVEPATRRRLAELLAESETQRKGANA